MALAKPRASTSFEEGSRVATSSPAFLLPTGFEEGEDTMITRRILSLALLIFTAPSFITPLQADTIPIAGGETPQPSSQMSPNEYQDAQNAAQANVDQNNFLIQETSHQQEESSYPTGTWTYSGFYGPILTVTATDTAISLRYNGSYGTGYAADFDIQTGRLTARNTGYYQLEPGHFDPSYALLSWSKEMDEVLTHFDNLIAAVTDSAKKEEVQAVKDYLLSRKAAALEGVTIITQATATGPITMAIHENFIEIKRFEVNYRYNRQTGSASSSSYGSGGYTYYYFNTNTYDTVSDPEDGSGSWVATMGDLSEYLGQVMANTSDSTVRNAASQARQVITNEISSKVVFSTSAYNPDDGGYYEQTNVSRVGELDVVLFFRYNHPTITRIYNRTTHELKKITQAPFVNSSSDRQEEIFRPSDAGYANELALMGDRVNYMLDFGVLADPSRRSQIENILTDIGQPRTQLLNDNAGNALRKYASGLVRVDTPAGYFLYDPLKKSVLVKNRALLGHDNGDEIDFGDSLRTNGVINKEIRDAMIAAAQAVVNAQKTTVNKNKARAILSVFKDIEMPEHLKAVQFRNDGVDTVLAVGYYGPGADKGLVEIKKKTAQGWVIDRFVFGDTDFTVPTYIESKKYNGDYIDYEFTDTTGSLYSANWSEQILMKIIEPLKEYQSEAAVFLNSSMKRAVKETLKIIEPYARRTSSIETLVRVKGPNGQKSKVKVESYAGTLGDVVKLSTKDTTYYLNTTTFTVTVKQGSVIASYFVGSDENQAYLDEMLAWINAAINAPGMSSSNKKKLRDIRDLISSHL